MGSLLPAGPNALLLPGNPTPIALTQIAVSKGLVACWPLDAGATNFSTNKTQDLSGANNSGTLVSMAASSAVIGPIGQALTFDGSADYVNCGNPSFANFGSGDFSMAAWVYNKSQTTLDSILSKDNLTERQWYFILNGDFTGAVSAGRLSAKVYASAANGYGIDSSAGVVSPNAWHHVVYRSAAGVQSLWLDGTSLSVTARPSGTGAPGITMANTATQLDIARREISGSTDEFDGSIADVRIYNRAIDPIEVMELYVAGMTGLNTKMFGIDLWDFPALAPQGVGFSPIFRKSASPIGGRVGSRQIWAA